MTVRPARLVVLTGASGSGKTTIAESIWASHSDTVDVLCFDSIGVPSLEATADGWGSVQEWQRIKTLEWMARIAATADRTVRSGAHGEAARSPTWHPRTPPENG